MTRPSLQRRLLWFIGLPVAALWLGAGLWLAQGARHETAEMFDRELERTAASVLAVIASTPDAAFAQRAMGQGGRRDDDEGPRPEIVVRDRSGQILLDASSLPPLQADGGGAHFHSLRHGGETWRVYQRWDVARRHWIQVAAPLHDRDELLWALMQGTLAPLLALLVLLPLATWLGLRGGLAPLRVVSRAIEAQPAHPPTLTRDDVPGELLQLTRAVDALVGTLDATLERERRFTADAAHELRHPLSVLQLELDLAGQAGDAASRQQHLQRARAGLQRMERLVTQLLTLARVESLEAVPDAAMLSLVDLVRTTVADASEHAQPRGVQLSLAAADDSTVRGSAGLLDIAIRNLIENAIAHGRSPGRVDIWLQARDGHVELVVDDDGPGFPEAPAQRLGERFLRSSGSGSGLGLSIVHAIARLHGGSLAAGCSPLGGARVVLRLPRQAGAQ
ncbi:sensor histidine kinase [Aerolutibacter ruishenii]|uniref:histidine kinase n=1 Tax=Aerolutibacter ruishenii TaxID=686800 RepID=A0A562LYB1_9GAMM|nr:ATP-binding protein [Lysobacter ruishenii]TWI12508.1 two-component system sensor histidine kinase QseC [Lysobacter ruishenii]